jgi:hypothetical protein
VISVDKSGPTVKSLADRGYLRLDRRSDRAEITGEGELRLSNETAAVDGTHTFAQDGPELDVVIDDAMPMDMPETKADVIGPQPREIYHAGRIRSVTMVAESSFAESVLELLDVPMLEPTRVTVASGYTITIPELWPEEWFDEPAIEDMPEFGGLRITASGRITGYLAPPNVVTGPSRARSTLTVPTAQDTASSTTSPRWWPRATVAWRGSARATSPSTVATRIQDPIRQRKCRGSGGL